MAKTFAIKTIGCKLNQYDSQAIRGLLERAGYVSCPFEGQADLYVVNTCTVTAKSDRDSRRYVRQAARRNPRAAVVVTGCYAQREPETLASLPGVSAVVGNEGKWNLPDLLDGGFHGREGLEAGDAGAQSLEPFHGREGPEGGNVGAQNFEPLRVRAFLKIQDGCDERCAYCVVPMVRGRSRSRSPAEILAEARRLIAWGHREIVLVGVHLGAYGAGLDGAATTNLAACVRELLGLPGLGRLRLSSLEPLEVNAEVISLLAGEPKLCRHLHLPLQSGDDAVLRRMNRKYEAAQYRRIVGEIVAAAPGVAVGADVIVGFPGETEEEFRNTGEFIESLPLAYLHVFSYSRRPGTPAACMPDQVPDGVKRQRCRALRALSERKALAFRRQLLGTRQTVVIEKDGGGEASGLTGNYVRVRLPNAPPVGSLVEVEITGVNGMEVLAHPLCSAGL